MTTRRERAERRIVPIVFPDGTVAGFMVRGWSSGQQFLGPFSAWSLAVEAALANTDRLAIGQQLRQERRRKQ